MIQILITIYIIDRWIHSNCFHFITKHYYIIKVYDKHQKLWILCVQDLDFETEALTWSWLPGAEALIEIHQQNEQQYNQVTQTLVFF